MKQSRIYIYSPSVTIGDNWPHVVNVGGLHAFFCGHLPSHVEVLPVMELLRLEQSLHLIRYGIVWIVTEVCRDLVGSGENRRASPAGDVQNLLVRCLLSHLYRVNGTHYEKQRMY